MSAIWRSYVTSSSYYVIHEAALTQISVECEFKELGLAEKVTKCVT